MRCTWFIPTRFATGENKRPCCAFGEAVRDALALLEAEAFAPTRCVVVAEVQRTAPRRPHMRRRRMRETKMRTEETREGEERRRQ